jgi:hypothetical protein
MKIHKISQSNIYLYHGTGEGHFRQIRKQGLIPVNLSGYVYLSQDEQYAQSYAERKGNEYGNRILRVKKTDDMIPDANTSFQGDFKTRRYIPASEIEVKINNKWIPIQDYVDESIGIMPLKESEVSFSVSVHEGENPIREEHGSQPGWIVVEENVPQFKLRHIIRQLYSEGYDDTSILIKRE